VRRGRLFVIIHLFLWALVLVGAVKVSFLFAELKEKCNTLEKILEGEREKVASLTETLQEREASLAELEERVGSLKKQLEQKDGEIEKLKAELASVANEREELGVALAKAEKEREKLREELSASLAQRDVLEAECKNLRRQLASAEERISGLLAWIAQHRVYIWDEKKEGNELPLEQRIKVAEELVEEGKFEQAWQQGLDMLSTFWQDAQAHRAFVDLALKMGKLEDCARVYASREAKDKFYHFGMGCVYKAGNRWEEAAGEFKTCLELDPAFLDAEREMGLCLAEMGRLSEARECLEHVYEQMQDEEVARALWDVYCRLGRQLSQRGKHKEAAEIFAKLASLESSVKVAEPASKRDDIARAIKEYHRRAKELYRQEKFAEAIAEWEKIIPLTPRHKLTLWYINRARKRLEAERLPTSE